MSGWLLVVDLKSLVGNEQNRHIMICSRTVLHDRSFREPDEMTRSVFAFVSDKRALQDVHPVRAGMGMPRVDDPGWVAHQAHFHAGIRINDQVLAKERAPDSLVGALLPGKRVAVDSRELGIWHLPIMRGR